MKEDAYSTFMDDLLRGDPDARATMAEHVGILLDSWARKERLELSWVAGADGLKGMDDLKAEVCTRLKKNLLDGKSAPERFADYKALVVAMAADILSAGFTRFLGQMAAGEQGAWQRVNRQLQIYAAKWLSERGLSGEAAGDVFQEALLTFFEKFGKEAGGIASSRELKSYFFRILELKSLEHGRKDRKHRQRFVQEDMAELMKGIADEPGERDERYVQIKEIMKGVISVDEMYILKRYYFFEDRLKSIAESLGISEVNCRQKKLVALRKIAAEYRRRKA